MASDRSPRKRKARAELIREAIRKNAAAKPPPLPGGMGMFDGGRADTSASRKELVREAIHSKKWR